MMGGKPLHFDVDHYLDSVEQMICADEIVLALKLLDMMPGYYRHHYPERAKQIKANVYRQLMTVTDYANDGDEQAGDTQKIFRTPLEEMYKHAQCYPRGELIVNLVRALNEQGLCAQIIELGPAFGWLPAALDSLKLDYEYSAYSITQQAKPVERSEKKAQVFVCFEVIEHLWNPDDIYHYYVKSGLDADFVMLSTPMGTLAGGLSNWESRELGHIRTYTPAEFVHWGKNHWNMNWQVLEADMMVLIGSKGNLSVEGLI